MKIKVIFVKQLFHLLYRNYHSSAGFETLINVVNKLFCLYVFFLVSTKINIKEAELLCYQLL